MLPPSDPSPENEAGQPPVAQPVQPAGVAASGPAVVATAAKPVVRKIKVRPKRPLARRPGVATIGAPRPATPRPERPSSSFADDEPETFFQRFGKFIIIGGIVVAGGAWLATKKPSPSGPAPKQERIVMIAPLPPLPPPPPPPPPPPKPPEEKMEKETAPVEDAKPVAKPDPVKAPDAPAPLGTNLKGDGPGLSGLGGGPGLGGGTLGTGTKSGGSRFGWYAGQVQAKISDALRRDPKTRNTSMRLTVRIWPDATGRITQAQLVGSTGDSALDAVIQNNVLTGLQLQEPPPAGMKLPINLRLTAQRPR